MDFEGCTIVFAIGAYLSQDVSKHLDLPEEIRHQVPSYSGVVVVKPRIFRRRQFVFLRAECHNTGREAWGNIVIHYNWKNASGEVVFHDLGYISSLPALSVCQIKNATLWNTGLKEVGLFFEDADTYGHADSELTLVY